MRLSRLSISLSMLAPVVVKPDIVSKSASVNEGICLLITKGRQPKKLNTIQLSAVMTQPSLNMIERLNVTALGRTLRTDISNDRFRGDIPWVDHTAQI